MQSGILLELGDRRLHGCLWDGNLMAKTSCGNAQWLERISDLNGPRVSDENGVPF